MTKKTLLGIILFLFSVQSYSFLENKPGWQFLANNNPFEAKKIFTANTLDVNPTIAGEAYRGLGASELFLGNNKTAMEMFFKSFLADGDTDIFAASWINNISFSRQWGGSRIKEGYKVLRILTQRPGIYKGDYFLSLAQRYVNDGHIAEAEKLTGQLGIIRSFRMIGPFENISGSGFNKIYAPEKEIDFTKQYDGKEGSHVRWHPYYNKDPQGWVFTEYNYSSSNAILYYYANIRSLNEQVAFIGFGASGSFKVFLNDNLILSDSIFRNTGTDMFIQKIRLFKGDNKLLIKIGHEESMHSNFLIRIMDQIGMEIRNVEYSNNIGVFKKDTIIYNDLRKMPGVDLVEKFFKNRLVLDSTDMEAAFLLMSYYNVCELHDAGQEFCRKFLRYYPSSSLWHSLYSESLLRSGKTTEASTELKTAFKLCRLNYDAWQNELETMSKTASSRDILNFIDNSPEYFKNSKNALVTQLSNYSKTNNENGVLKSVTKLEELHSDDCLVVNILANRYLNQGNIKKAEKILLKHIEFERTCSQSYSLLAGLYLKMGKLNKVFKTFECCLRYSPNSSGYLYYLAKLSLQNKAFKNAKTYIDRALEIAPTASQFLNIKGMLYATQNKTEEAKYWFKESILFNYNDFDAWDNLINLEGKPSLNTLVQLPDPDSLIKKSVKWEHSENEEGVIIADIKDIFYYPSHCSRERYFLIVKVPTQKAIDIWKEYSINYNGYFQSLNILRSFSKKTSGEEINADISGNTIVFKSLEQGDYIILEWSLENYYPGRMAGHVWGNYNFSLVFPVYKSELRLVAPENDTIPYFVHGRNIDLAGFKKHGFKIVFFSRPPYNNPPKESFMAIDQPDNPKVDYSTLTSWGDVASWYSELTENKLMRTTELKYLAESLFSVCITPEEKVLKLHKYITGNIRYGFIPFRQSGWVPQSSREVLASKIGDCKDMSALGKSLLDYAGIPNKLVLLNTRDENSIYPGYIGPNFNHCIISYVLNDQVRYLDLTENNLSIHFLPKTDQGALALVIEKNNFNLINLPSDYPENRVVSRKDISYLDDSGLLKRKIATMKLGIFAASMRESYRFLSEKEQKAKMQKVLARDYPGLILDTLLFKNLDLLTDTLEYTYAYNVKKASTIHRKIMIFPLNISDNITGEDYPSEEERKYPIDMRNAWFDIAKCELSGELTLPASWKLIDIPEPVKLESKYGNYSFAFRINGNKLVYQRNARFVLKDFIPPSESKEFKNFMSQIAQSDNIQLTFIRK